MRALLLSGVVALVWSGAAVAAPIVGDASFEAVSTGAQGYVYDPKDAAGFGFSGYAGVARNGSAFGFSGAPDGSQVGFIQSYHGSSGGNIGQTIAGLTVGTTYTVSFDLAARAAPYAADPIFLLLTNTTGSGGGATGMSTSSLGTFTPTGTGFQAFTTASFVAGGPTSP